MSIQNFLIEQVAAISFSLQSAVLVKETLLNTAVNDCLNQSKKSTLCLYFSKSVCIIYFRNIHKCANIWKTQDGNKCCFWRQIFEILYNSIRIFRINFDHVHLPPHIIPISMPFSLCKNIVFLFQEKLIKISFYFLNKIEWVIFY